MRFFLLKDKALPCRPTEFSCLDRRQCVHKNWVCDGKPDCADESDEKYKCYIGK